MGSPLLSTDSNSLKPLRLRSRLGKYRIEKRLGEGGFASVYQAFDTIEGQRVALKIPNGSLSDADADIRREIRLAARLKQPHILPLKSADEIDGRLVLVYPLGEKTLADRLRSRLRVETALTYFEQMLAGVSAAHAERVVHCDVKPDNLILIDGELYLTDFGLAKIAMRTIRASGSGTLGYCSPEQAMGQPSFRSDVFACALVGYRMLAGELPEWPFDWPPPGMARLRKRVHRDVIALLRKGMQLDPKKRYANATRMLEEFRRLRPKASKRSGSKTSEKKKKKTPQTDNKSHWKEVQWRQFQREFGKQLQTKHACEDCGGPVAEEMTACPWCGVDRLRHTGENGFPICCPRCHRGMKPDWAYCPWCYGPGFEVDATRSYPDKRYVAARCPSTRCEDRRLMAFMRYCPWCRTKVRKKWKIEGSTATCDACSWGVAGEYWDYCPWCGKRTRS